MRIIPRDQEKKHTRKHRRDDLSANRLLKDANLTLELKSERSRGKVKYLLFETNFNDNYATTIKRNRQERYYVVFLLQSTG